MILTFEASCVVDDLVYLRNATPQAKLKAPVLEDTGHHLHLVLIRVASVELQISPELRRLQREIVIRGPFHNHNVTETAPECPLESHFCRQHFVLSLQFQYTADYVDEEDWEIFHNR